MRFDHAVIGVADLDRAIAAYAALGFVVLPGGRHTGEGTHNAIIRFGLDYLELMAVHDPALARSRPFGSQLLDFLADRDGGLIGYVVAGEDLDTLAQAMRGTGLEPTGPFAMQRERDDGNILRWRLLFPSGQRWRDIAPFVIEWATGDADRTAWDAPVPHPNGVTGVSGLVVVAPDLARASQIYGRALGLPIDPDGAGRARSAVGGVAIELFSSAERTGAGDRSGPIGEGLHEIVLQVNDMAAAAKVIPGLDRGAGGRYRIPPRSALGARLVVAEVSGPGS